MQNRKTSNTYELGIIRQARATPANIVLFPILMYISNLFRLKKEKAGTFSGFFLFQAIPVVKLK